jgi:hypothetical protein
VPDINLILWGLTNEINKGVQGKAWPLVRSLAFRIIGTGPQGPTYPIQGLPEEGGPPSQS